MPRTDEAEQKGQTEKEDLKQVQLITQEQLTNIKLDQLTEMVTEILEYYKPKETKE